MFELKPPADVLEHIQNIFLKTFPNKVFHYNWDYLDKEFCVTTTDIVDDNEQFGVIVSFDHGANFSFCQSRQLFLRRIQGDGFMFLKLLQNG